MPRILDINESGDDRGYEFIQRLGDTSATKQEIDVDPLFIESENLIISRLPTAELPGRRSLSDRVQEDILLALAYYTAAAFQIGGGRTAGTTTAVDTTTGDIESETIGDITRRFRAAGSSHITRRINTALDTEDRYKYLLNKAEEIMTRLGASGTTTTSSSSFLGYAGKLSGR